MVPGTSSSAAPSATPAPAPPNRLDYYSVCPKEELPIIVGKLRSLETTREGHQYFDLTPSVQLVVSIVSIQMASSKESAGASLR